VEVVPDKDLHPETGGANLVLQFPSKPALEVVGLVTLGR
jgi:hypothetical protein